MKRFPWGPNRRDGAGFVVYSAGYDGLDGGGLHEENDILFRCGK